MDDQRIDRALRSGPEDEPVYPPLGVAVVTDRGRRRPGGPGRAWALARVSGTAAVLLAVLMFAPAWVGSPSDLWRSVQQTGHIVVGVTAGSPQVGTGGRLEAFDVDVSREVGRRLELRVLIEPIDSALAADGAWDMVLHPAPLLSLSDHLDAGVPFYERSAAILVAGSAAATAIGDLDGATLCVVDGGLADRWAGGRLQPLHGRVSVPPADLRLVRDATGKGCIERLRSGEADAVAVDWDLDVDPLPAGLARLAEAPFVTAVTPVVDASVPGSDRLLAAVEGAIRGLRAIGRLTELSQQRFGGRDLTLPQQ